MPKYYLLKTKTAFLQDVFMVRCVGLYLLKNHFRIRKGVIPSIDILYKLSKCVLINIF